MPRGRHNKEIPKNLYYVQATHACYGPYWKKPTLVGKEERGLIIQWQLDENGNFIRINTSE